MCRQLEDLLGEEIVQGVAVVPRGSVQALIDSGKGDLVPRKKFEFLDQGNSHTVHKSSCSAAEYISGIAASLKTGDILITLISGGGSTLVALPKPPLTLEDKMSVVQLMKSHGVAKLEQDLVHKNLSLIKGGGLSEMAAPAKVISVILSDLPHALSAQVSGGLTSTDSSTPQQALEILQKYHLGEKAPKAVIDLLAKDAQEAKSRKLYEDSPNIVFSGPNRRRDTSNTINIVAGTEEIAVRGILQECNELGIPAKNVIQSASNTNTAENGLLLACISQYVTSLLTRRNNSHTESDIVSVELECIKMGMTKTELKEIARISEDAKNAKKPVCLIFNSEVTVHLRGSGKGGPCQETALATAIYLKQRHRQHEALQACDVQLLSIDSDGTDGGTNVAGALANHEQAECIVNGKTAQEYLDNNDSFNFYKHLDNGRYHVTTGPTGTDIQNLQILLIRNRSW
ncbi:GLYCTK [Bugula neritina]|uniref:GLYCTK n=1 Tax=Bugula neritina TaxID=10212 RepID=A0A7J7JTI6_BUGNE|nr:GLYCTK [Bugula neritina]